MFMLIGRSRRPSKTDSLVYLGDKASLGRVEIRPECLLTMQWTRPENFIVGCLGGVLNDIVLRITLDDPVTTVECGGGRGHTL
jgi:hypothetical protein